MELEQLTPDQIEQRSFEIITKELGGRIFDPLQEPVIKRVIHTTADFDYADNLVFSPGVVEHAHRLLQNSACIVTDTKMAMSGINKSALSKLGAEVYNFISDEDVAAEAKERGETRSAVAMEKAARLNRPTIFAIGNAPTALIRLYELMENDGFMPGMIIAVPVGFVNVVQAKELILSANVPSIVAKGRKGGSNVAAAIVNALMYQLTRENEIKNDRN
ncbi:MAG: precorrin-8X methylmutase [Lachnospiraceae bacterium]|nr:precorrin-8X methylmutase [Lachnospiraceae bacterium]